MTLTNTELINLLASLASLIDANNKNEAGGQIRKQETIDTANWIALKILDKFRLI